MTRMPNIKLSKKEVKRLMNESFFSSGSEAIVCKTNNPHTLYKVFRRGKHPTSMSDNKYKKVERLYQMALQNSVHPLSTLSCNGELIGYEMMWDPNDSRFYPATFPRSERIRLLKESENILEYFSEHNITYGDVASRNILINRRTGELKFCDMDNIRLGEYPIDSIGDIGSLADYSELRGIDNATDAYMHNLLTLNAFGLDIHYSDPEDFQEEFNRPIVEIIESMREPETFNGEYIIQYIKK